MKHLSAIVFVALAALASLIARTKSSNTLAIIRAAYQDPKAGDWLSGRTGVPAVTLPFTVGGTHDATDLFSLYDDTINRLLSADQSGDAE